MLHRFAQLVAASTVFLVLAGSLVTSTDSGLAVPDWPTTYGWNMFTFPPSKWVGGIFYEHGHRLIASAVGMLTIVLAAWLWTSEARGWMKRLGAIALAAVILQGLLGGLTVLFFLPAPVSTAHAALAEIFFCLTVAIALFTSPGWLRGDGQTNDSRLRGLATATTALVYVQILVGATMRHTDAGLAIPDFPLMLGGLVPEPVERGDCRALRAPRGRSRRGGGSLCHRRPACGRATGEPRSSPGRRRRWRRSWPCRPRSEPGRCSRASTSPSTARTSSAARSFSRPRSC